MKSADLSAKPDICSGIAANIETSEVARKIVAYNKRGHTTLSLFEDTLFAATRLSYT